VRRQIIQPSVLRPQGEQTPRSGCTSRLSSKTPRSGVMDRFFAVPATDRRRRRQPFEMDVEAVAPTSAGPYGGRRRRRGAEYGCEDAVVGLRARNKRAVVDHDGSPSIERGRPPILNAQCSIHNSDAPAERQPQAQAKREPRGWKREANYPASITASLRCRPAAARGAARRGGDPPRPQGCPWSSPPTS
jgi:hypothetical protein